MKGSFQDLPGLAAAVGWDIGVLAAAELSSSVPLSVADLNHPHQVSHSQVMEIVPRNHIR